MQIRVQVVDEFGDIEKEYGLIEKEKVQHLINEAERLNLDCLSGLDIDGDTYFNDLQCLQLKNELKILREESQIDSQLMNWIENSIGIILPAGYLFLKFIGK